jgi:hypothetical protein
MPAPTSLRHEGTFDHSDAHHAEVQDDTAHIIQLKPILDAQEEYRPIFRREVSDVAYASFHSTNNKDPNEQTYMKDDRASADLRTQPILLDTSGIEWRQNP